MSNSSKYFNGKQCKNCGNTLRYKSSNACVTCTRIRSAKWQKNNKERKSEYDRKYHLSNREKKCAVAREWTSSNKLRKRESGKRWYRNNRERHAEKSRNWRKANPEKKRALEHKREVKKRNALSEPYDFKAICKHYKNRCLRCEQDDVKLTIDHIIPISKGGNDIASNIQPLCQPCNSGKKDRHIDYRPDAGPLRWLQRKLFG